MNTRECLIVATHTLEIAIGQIKERRRVCAEADFIETPMGELEREAIGDAYRGLSGMKTLEIIARSTLPVEMRDTPAFALAGPWGKKPTVNELLAHAAANEYARLTAESNESDKMLSFSDLAVSLISKPDGQAAKYGCFRGIVQTIYDHFYSVADEPRLYDFFTSLHSSIVRSLVKTTG